MTTNLVETLKIAPGEGKGNKGENFPEQTPRRCFLKVCFDPVYSEKYCVKQKLYGLQDKKYPKTFKGLKSSFNNLSEQRLVPDFLSMKKNLRN